MNDKLIALFVECFNNCDNDTKISIHNAYVRENYPDNEVYSNDDEFFETFYNNRPADAVRAVFFGDYRYNDKYVWFNGYGNLESSDFYAALEDEETMGEWFIDNYSEIEYISEMEEFCNACENGFDDEDDEDEDEE